MIWLRDGDRRRRVRGESGVLVGCSPGSSLKPPMDGRVAGLVVGG